MNNSTKQNSASAPNKVINVAPVGYFILELVIGENNLPSEVMRHPVIAWAINTEASDDFLIPEAITLGGNVEGGDTYLQNAPVLCPDGLVRGSTDRQWQDEAEYLRDSIERAAAELRYKALQCAKAA